MMRWDEVGKKIHLQFLLIFQKRMTELIERYCDIN